MSDGTAVASAVRAQPGDYVLVEVSPVVDASPKRPSKDFWKFYLHSGLFLLVQQSPPTFPGWWPGGKGRSREKDAHVCTCAACILVQNGHAHGGLHALIVALVPARMHKQASSTHC